VRDANKPLTMDMYLIELIDRMNDDSDHNIEKGYNSADTISWKATREAEKISTIDFIEQLQNYIKIEKDKKKRDKAYFIIANIAKNTNDQHTAGFLIQRLKNEKDKYIISSLLYNLSKITKPKGTDLTSLIVATQSDKWLIRHSAIQAFVNTNDEIAESTLTNILDKTEDPYDIIYANSTLGKIGTLKSIPFLEQHLTSKKRDVKGSAQFAIEEIKKRHVGA
jgi:HEAT repeat protein